MRTTRLAIAVALAAAAASFSTAARADDDEAKTLKAKHEAVRYSLKTTEPANPIDTGGAMIFVDAPIATVRKIVQDYGHYNVFLKPFEQSRVLSKKKGTSEIYLAVSILHGAMTIWAEATMPPPEKDGAGEKIVAHYQKGNLADFRATWRLRAVDADHTILKLEVLVDPKLPLPAKKITDELESAADKGVTEVRDRALETKPAQAVATADDAEKKSGDAKK